MLVDTHCHLTYPELVGDVDGVLRRAGEAGVERVVTVATSVADARRALELMADRPQIWLAAGVHPHAAAKVSDEDLAALADLHHGRWNLDAAVQRRLAAVGECGLDFHYDFAPADVQERVFRCQLALAADAGRPVIIHARKAEMRVCDILRDYPTLRGRAVFHCFSSPPDVARRVLDDGHWLSYTGVLTFPNAEETRASALITPLDRCMVETDAPFLSPVPVRKVRPCEPAFTAHTARALAALRGMPFEALAAMTTANAARFFAIG